MSAWTSYITEVATANTVAPGSPTADPDIDSAVLSWTHPNSPNAFSSVLYRSDTNDIDDAVPIYTVYGGPNATQQYTDTSLSGSYWWWVVAFNASEVGSAPNGPLTATF